MSLFNKTKVVLWPRTKTTEFYFNRKDNNNYSFDLSLWQARDEATLSALSQFIADNGISEVTVLLPDDVVFTKSFVYDTKITSIEKSEVAQLAQAFVNFPIDPNSLEFTLSDSDKDDKTIINCLIFDKDKVNALYSNLASLGIKTAGQTPISASVASVVSTFFSDQYFLLYPLTDNELVFLLARGKNVYMTTILKGNSFDIQKIINYSNLYFKNPTTKLFVPSSSNLELNSTTKLDKTSFDDHQIAQNLNQPSNLPLPVTGVFLNTAVTPQPKADIINVITPVNKPKIMEENKRNILPIIAVFILTAGIASVIFWYVVNRNQSNVETPVSENNTETPTPTIEETPTLAPSPTAADIPKTIKIQVLNATEINGQAATLKAKLTALGFKNIAVGNAKETLTSNQVKTKAEGTAYSAYFQSKLGDYFPGDYASDLPASSTYDVVFYIGTDLSKAAPAPASSTSEEAADTVTPTTKAAKTSVTPTPTKKLSPTPTE